MAAPTFVAQGAKSVVTSGNLTSIGLPAGILAGDILVCVCTQSDNVVSTINQSYTIKDAANNGTTCRVMVAWVRATGSDTAPTITHAAGSNCIARITAYRGAIAAGDPFDADGGLSTASTTTMSAAAVTPVNANDLVLWLGGWTVAGNTSFANTAGTASGTVPTFTKRSSDVDDTNVNEAGLTFQDGPDTATASTGARTVTLNIGAGLSLSVMLAMQGAAAASPAFTPRRMPLGV